MLPIKDHCSVNIQSTSNQHYTAWSWPRYPPWAGTSRPGPHLSNRSIMLSSCSASYSLCSPVMPSVALGFSSSHLPVTGFTLKWRNWLVWAFCLTEQLRLLWNTSILSLLNLLTDMMCLNNVIGCSHLWLEWRECVWSAIWMFSCMNWNSRDITLSEVCCKVAVVTSLVSVWCWYQHRTQRFDEMKNLCSQPIFSQ